LNSIAEKILWPSRSDAPPLADNEIHVWATTLSMAAAGLELFSATLTPDEKERAKKSKFEKHRNRYIAGRGALRAILGQYLDARAADLRFDYLTNGKPAFAQDFAGAGIHFNLAHTEDLALIAVTRIGPIGVDVECVRPTKNVDELVARFFSQRENELFQKVPNDQKPVAFFNLWTPKEAMLKATGEGITRSLSLVEVSFLPGEPAKLLAISGDEAAAEEWFLRELSPANEFVGAAVVHKRTSNTERRTPNIEEPLINVSSWKWTSDFQLGTEPSPPR
jgi:4'-phosphopantetheinyl transferase